MSYTFLVVGTIFPALSLWSIILVALHKRSGKPFSGLYVPFIGPICIDVWLSSRYQSNILLIIPWLVDLGTLLFLAFLPQLLLDIWRTSSFTRLMLLRGVKDNQSVELRLQKSGNYVLKKRWDRAKGEIGVTALSEPGTYSIVSTTLHLTSHIGVNRRIEQNGPHFMVHDLDSVGAYSIDGWRLNQLS